MELSNQGRCTELQDVLNLFTDIRYSENEERKKKEEDIVFNFLNAMEAIFNNENKPVEVFENPLNHEDNSEQISQKTTLSIEDIVMFFTGSKFITASMKNVGTINFLHCEEGEKNFDGTRITVNTCGLSITFPVNKRYSNFDFIDHLVEDVHTSPGFGKG